MGSVCIKEENENKKTEGETIEKKEVMDSEVESIYPEEQVPIDLYNTFVLRRV